VGLSRIEVRNIYKKLNLVANSTVQEFIRSDNENTMPLNKLLNRKKKNKLHTHTHMQVHAFTYRNSHQIMATFALGFPFNP